ncbi:hypothetical protein PQU96_09765 [Vogesella sp. LYT5W]|uniref:Uncharacterized protein n=1 Tax=Vogesella margarita TaxID=2984199 RepID=A0ABT5IPB4_9NEIS|nr:hypothetical protein [Vogesella margarita]MDC7714413.1 hypothetical protein [Vogesella margarita]
MTAEEYLADAQMMIKMAGKEIAADMSDQGVIAATTFFSLGVERLLKFILADVNPVFVLSNGDFKNAAPCLYKHKFVNDDQHKVTSSQPDHDVVSFRLALQRALLFSNGVKNNSQLLYTLANHRDILAHRPLSELNIPKAKRLLAKDAYKLLNDICSERAMPTNGFFGENNHRLQILSNRLQREEVITQEMTARLEQHRAIWVERSSKPGFVSQAEHQTATLLQRSGQDFSYESIDCPACAQQAVARIEPDYDYDPAERISFVTGVFVDSINCYFCDLTLTDYEELNYVDANSILHSD